MNKEELANKHPVCSFKLLENGDLTELKIATSSGSEAVDKEALRIISGVSPVRHPLGKWPDCPKKVLVSFYDFNDLILTEIK
ncbi:MAG: energy transducer TonB [Cyanobacteria bacterium SZAS LIN-2]|nr:energy transducer TonB [Cyanobacteria bacterium SZAS LIN-2]